MIYIILFIFLFYFAYNKLTKKYINSYTLDIYFGKKGSGKTTLMTKLALDHLKKGWFVYANFYIPGCYQFDIDDIGSYQFKYNSLILIDEAGIIFNNREYKNFKKTWREFFALQRKYGNKIVMCSQSYNIDKALRDLADNLYVVSKPFRLFSFIKKVNKKVGIKNDGETGGQLIEEYKFVGLPKIIYIPRYACLFDSFERPVLDQMKVTYNKLSETQEQLLKTKGYLVYKISTFFLDLKADIKKLLEMNPKELKAFIKFCFRKKYKDMEFDFLEEDMLSSGASFEDFAKLMNDNPDIYYDSKQKD